MNRLSPARLRASMVALAVTVFGALAFAPPAFAAGPPKPMIVVLEGQAVAEFCSDGSGLVCQTTTFSGFATQFGFFTGVQTDRVDITTGAFTCSATLTNTFGESLTTVCSGQATPTSETSAIFVEEQEFVSGTGRFVNVSGSLNVQGVLDAGHISAFATGTISR